MTGAEALIRCLEAQEVKYIFGYPGGAVIPIFDAIETTKTNIKLILTRHEQGAAHIADGYARATGKPGVVLVTSGPAAGNIITGLMTAHMDSVPIIAISGQQITSMLGLDAFQEADVFNLTMPVVKHNYLVLDVNDVPQTVHDAFEIATSGRPGPVLIDMPKNITSATYSGSLKQAKPALHHKTNVPKPNKNTLGTIARIIENSKRPVFLIGHGVLIAGGERALAKAVQQFDVPVVTTLLGKGAYDETAPHALGMLGMHGMPAANKAILDADMIINIGSRFDDRITGDVVSFGENATIVHVDIDRAEIGKMIKPDFSIHADAKAFLEALVATKQTAKHHEWLQDLHDYQQAHPLPTEGADGLTQQYVLHEINTLTGGEAIITTDVGQHQMWAAQFCKTKHPGDWISSGGAGTMGFGLPSAIGAQFGQPGKQVVAIVGDGGFQMTQFELATAAIHKLPIKIVIMDNKYLGMVRQWQELFYDNRLSGVDLVGNPNFGKLAESYGIKSFHISEKTEVAKTLKQAFDYNDGPVLIHCEVAKTDNVYPMIPPGSGYSGMLLSPPTEKLEKPTGST